MKYHYIGSSRLWARLRRRPQVVSALPPARLAGALLGGASDTRDTLLVERLEWLRSERPPHALDPEVAPYGTGPNVARSQYRYSWRGGLRGRWLPVVLVVVAVAVAPLSRVAHLWISIAWLA